LSRTNLHLDQRVQLLLGSYFHPDLNLRQQLQLAVYLHLRQQLQLVVYLHPDVHLRVQMQMALSKLGVYLDLSFQLPTELLELQAQIRQAQCQLRPKLD